MFTGLIECVGKVCSIEPDASADGVLRITIEAPKISHELRPGESVAVSGACLTVVSASAGMFSAQIMRETLRSTKLGALQPGARVNLERAMRPDGRFDGHIVQGHVDEVGTVLSVESLGGSKQIAISMSDALAPGVAPKGSICIDGISLTVISSDKASFSVGIIPTTMAETTIGSVKVGDPVNLEMDVLARYIMRMLESVSGSARRGGGSLSWTKLAEYGWI